MLLHDACNAVLAADFTRLSQIGKHSASAIYAVAGGVRVADQLQQAPVFLLMLRYGVMYPSVEPCTSYPSHSAHQTDCVLAAVLVDKAVLHSGSLAKYRTAFFKISRSSSMRRI